MKKVLVLGSFCAALACAQAVQIKVTNAASYQTSAGIAPRTLVSIFGQGLSAVTMIAPDPAHLPKSLGGATVSVNGVLCGVYMVSPTQISAQLDESIQTGQVDLAVETPIVFAVARVIVEPRSSPAIFTLNGKGSSDGAILNAVTFGLGAFNVTGPFGPTYLALFVTGLDSTATPTVSIGGVMVPVQYFGDHPLFQGLQQINVQLTPQLAGLGRVEVVVEQRGRRSNAVEVVLLPNAGVFPSDQPNQIRTREAAAIAWVPGTSLALVADENDDVVRVVDVDRRRVTRVIALPDGAQPVSIGAWGNGSLALVALRGRDSVALVDLATFAVRAEYPVGRGPSGIAVAQDQAVVINSDSDSATFFDFRNRLVVGTAATGRLPRGVTADLQRIYVTNQSDGTITSLDWTTHSAVSTIKLGVDTRPGAIQVLPGVGFAAVAEPSAGPQGKLLFVNLATGAMFALPGNPEGTGGASAMLLLGEKLYLANQTGGSITTLGADITTTTVGLIAPANIHAESGTRALAFDARENLVLALNQGAGSISLIDPASGTVTGRIDAVRVTASDDDDNADRLAAPNLPALSLMQPGTARSDTTFTLELLGTNLNGATAVLFLDPAAVPGLVRGRGNVNRGNLGVQDRGITVSNIQVSADGTQLTAQVHIDRGHATGARVLRVLTPNGETSLAGALSMMVNQ